MTLLSSSPSSSISVVFPLPGMELSLAASRALGRSVTSPRLPGEAKEVFWQGQASLCRARPEPVWLHFPGASHQVFSLGLEPSHRPGGWAAPGPVTHHLVSCACRPGVCRRPG